MQSKTRDLLPEDAPPPFKNSPYLKSNLVNELTDRVETMTKKTACAEINKFVVLKCVTLPNNYRVINQYRRMRFGIRKTNETFE